MIGYGRAVALFETFVILPRPVGREKTAWVMVTAVYPGLIHTSCVKKQFIFLF
jgi:hypothetical protein